ncbi:MAG: DMT family transporter [Oscillospiraceae bacterium]|nr:DMT family transporter [Oscillospiraceae bacterium]
MTKQTLAVLGAGALWGTMGLFTRSLAAIGIGPAGAILVRCAIAALFFALMIALRDPRAFRVAPKDLWCFFGSGVCSLLFFTFCYFNAISLLSLSAAAILLYTAPVIVVLLSAWLFREKLNGLKLAALALAFLGCCLVSGLTRETALPLRGLLFGLGAGFGYALYSIFARLALDRGYTSSTVNLYSCLLAALGAGLIWGFSEPFAAMTASWSSVGLCLLAGLVTCFLPYLLYTYGLSRMETGRASILASVEPVVATLLGVLIYHEALTLRGALGILCVLAAVFLLNSRSKKA